VGIGQEELFFIDMNLYLKNNPEIKLMDKDVQNLRYERFEALRQATVLKVSEERNWLMNPDKSASKSRMMVK